ncbi:MAG TPA: CCA tRNA nucleotidyltransferase [Longimicrobiaceae bacterium]|nr:CCA tRNA nucleotidyltransferase [Longimicrobiaceae bacterium]
MTAGSSSSARLPAPREVQRITRILRDAGFDTWAVGGAVRDALAGMPSGDWDLTTSARPADVQRIFRRTVPIGVEHGTVGVLGKDGVLYEVTTFRRDVETSGRHAVVAFADTLEEDLERRDFTINAVAWNPLTDEIRDPHGGATDLKNGLLRTVGAAASRFAEDRLRVLRALRFAGRFELRIDEATWAAACSVAEDLHMLSAERIREELIKVMALPCPAGALQLYADSGVLREIYPEIQRCIGLPDGEHAGDVFTHLLSVVDLCPPKLPLLRLAALLHDVGKSATAVEVDGTLTFPDHAAAGAAMAREILRRLKASNASTDRVVHLVAQHSGVPEAGASTLEIRRWLRVVGAEYAPDLYRLRLADRCAHYGDEQTREIHKVYRRVLRIIRARPPLEISDLAVNGEDLRRLGIPAGPLYGEILRELLNRVVDDPELNSKDELLALVREELA